SRKQVAPGSGDWSDWAPVNLPGTVRSVAAMRQFDGYLQVMAVMTDGSVEWEGEQQAGWGPWSQLGPPGNGVEVSAGQEANGGLTVYAVTRVGTIINTYQQDTPGLPWTAWESAPSFRYTATSVGVADLAPQRLSLVAVCTDGTLRYIRE